MIRIVVFFLLISLLSGCQADKEEAPTGKPTVYLIGDSTVKNGRGDGADGLWGWGEPLALYFDTTRIRVENHALGGTSSRTFRTQGHWEEVLHSLQAGDYVLIQFGHNDAGPVNDNFRARGTFEGISDKMEEIDNLLTGEREVVHTYGWYLRQYIVEAKEKGAIPVVLSPISRNNWVNGEVLRDNASYSEWAREVATFEEVEFIDLNEKMARAMEALGEDSVTGTFFFKNDPTHTTAKGAIFAASLVVEGLNQASSCKLKDYLQENPTLNFPVKRNLFLVSNSPVKSSNEKAVDWSRELPAYLDTSRLNIFTPTAIANNGLSYYSERFWNELMEQMKEDDFLLIQLGRSSTKNSPNAQSYSYTEVLKKHLIEAKAKGVVVILISPTPHNKWSGGKLESVSDSNSLWARDLAQSGQVFYIDLNHVITLEYEAMGPQIARQLFTNDPVRTNAAGARLTALTLAKELKKLQSCALSGYVNLNRGKL
ncbi:GDSL-type esterase/lipase family protein [uncultured Sunxiuqinia sp.]|uniref:GDSL-type esterase/lipase family protein n=1 Tax=uncultured Sunxiuqinia sp. TaxID=1573825 RepID=UPI00261E75A3|nr:GDSL-type esterase/lipase family protein [uncultured Sunxiuqinia sp.]